MNIYYAKYVITSNTSFSYFPIKTSSQEKTVIAPMYWSRHNQSKRWLSPCNLYSDWLWQDQKGNINKYTKCLKLTEETRNYYSKYFYINVHSKKLHKKGLKDIIPKELKKYIKHYISKVFPKFIG